jgi:hypothetical protein
MRSPQQIDRVQPTRIQLATSVWKHAEKIPETINKVEISSMGEERGVKVCRVYWEH